MLTCVYLLIGSFNFFFSPVLQSFVLCCFCPPTHVCCPLCLFFFSFFGCSVLVLFSFRLTHSLTLMHASLLENGCTSLPGESVTRSSAWSSHDLDQKVCHECPNPVGYNCFCTGSDSPEYFLNNCFKLAAALTFLLCANDVMLTLS